MSRNRVLAAGLVAGTALVAGCSAAPAGTATTSPVFGQVRVGKAAKNFAPFPVPDRWNGYGGHVYMLARKATTGKAARQIGITAGGNMVFWLNCIGTGKAQVASAAIKLKWSVPCGNGADPAGVNVLPADDMVGHQVTLDLTVTSGSRWEFRIDQAAPKGIGLPADTVPKR